MAASAYNDTIEKIYIAYYGRAADPTGLTYWANQLDAAKGDVRAIINAFGISSESSKLYTGTNIDIVTAIYQQLFGRAPDADGLKHYVYQLDTKAMTAATIAYEVMAAAVGTDKTIVDNKLVAANAFTAALDTSAEISGYQGDAANASARAWLSTVNSTAASVTAATSTINATIDTILAGGTGTAGTTFTLTSSADTLDPNSATAALKTTANNDTFRAPSDGLLTTADYIDGGAGNDTLTATAIAAGQTLAPVLKSVENVTLTVTAADAKTFTFNAADVTGANYVTIKGATAASQDDYLTPDELITVSNLAKTTTLGINGGSGTVAANTASAITATFTGAVAADTQKVMISDKGTVGLLTLSTAETVEITAVGNGTAGANTIENLAATAVKTLNLKGSGDLTIAASDLAATVTVNASTSTGKITFTGETAATSTTFTGGSGQTSFTTASTGTVNVTTGAANDTVNISGGNSVANINVGAGNDRVLVGAQSNVTASDVIVGGDGTDIIAISDATVNGTTKTTLALGVSGFEQLETTATSGLTIDFSALSAYDTVIASGVSAVAAQAANSAAAGTAAINVTTMENTDALVISAAITGGAGGTSAADSAANAGGVGGTGIVITPKLDAGGNVATLKFIGNADVIGGAGGAAAESGDTAGAGGKAVDASLIETLNIDIAGTLSTGTTGDTVTFGTAAGGSSITVGTNATINLTSSLSGSGTIHNNVDLGTVLGQNVTVDGSNFLGNITVTTANGNTTIKGGAGADSLTGAAGIDTISGGAGADIITGAAGADVLSGGTGRDAFVIGTAGHSGTSAYDTISDFGLVSSATNAAQVTAQSSVAAFQATATAAGGVNADVLKFAAAATLGGAQAATAIVSAVGDLAGKTITAAETAKGVLTLGGADAAAVNTLAEWVAVADTMAGAAGNVVVFEFGGNTYVFQQGATDDLVQLTGVTGSTGIVVGGGTVAAAVGDIFVL